MNRISIIALEADPNEPEDRAVTHEAVERALADRRSRGRPPVENPKPPVTMRLDQDVLDQDVLDHCRSTGRGWQTRIDEVLRNTVRLG